MERMKFLRLLIDLWNRMRPLCPSCAFRLEEIPTTGFYRCPNCGRES